MWIIIFVIICVVAGAIWVAKNQNKQNVKFESDIASTGFNATKKVFYGQYMLLIDEPAKKWAVKDKNNDPVKVYDFKDLLDVEIFEDGVNVGQTSSIGKAIVGGALFGVAGALIGGGMGGKKNECTSLRLNIVVNSLDKPFINLDFVSSPIKRESLFYKTALQAVNNMAAALTVIQYNK